MCRPPTSTLFPYTTLFRSGQFDGFPLQRSEAGQREGYRISAGPQFADSVAAPLVAQDRKSTRLNSSHGSISYAVFCLKKKKKIITHTRFDELLSLNFELFR